jgi:hypothetical protein
MVFILALQAAFNYFFLLFSFCLEKKQKIQEKVIDSHTSRP